MLRLYQAGGIISQNQEEQQSMSTLQDKVVIVTGAGTGIGAAIAADFVNQGAKVALVGRRLEKLAEASAGLPKAQILLHSCDVADRTGVQALIEQVEEQFGSVDILVNNAGDRKSVV